MKHITVILSLLLAGCSTPAPINPLTGQPDPIKNCQAVFYVDPAVKNSVSNEQVPESKTSAWIMAAMTAHAVIADCK